MRSLLLGSLILVVGAVSGFYVSKVTQPEVKPYWGLTFGDKLGEVTYAYLSATGSWADGSANKVNRVHVNCDPSRSMCTVMTAEVLKYEVFGDQLFLELEPTYFSIKSIDATSVTAVDEDKDACIRKTLLVDRAAKAVSLIQTKDPDARCIQIGYPKTWSLVDPPHR